MLNNIALSAGEPSGIGSLSTLLILKHKKLIEKKIKNKFNLHIFNDLDFLNELNRRYLKNKKIHHLLTNPNLAQNKNIYFRPVQLIDKAELKKVNFLNAAFVLESLNQAITFVKNNPNCALVTSPIDKAIIQKSIPNFTGHTHYLANHNQDNSKALMNFSILNFYAKKKKSLQIALLCDHLSLKNSLKKLQDKQFIQEKIILFHKELKNKFNIDKPKIALIGLNPHAGENGSFGDEEINIYAPLIQQLQQKNINIIGPFAADNALLLAKKNSLDGLISLYHDQILPVIKHSYFENSVNITLGINFIRTSVDHGCAYDICNDIEKINLKPLQNAIWQALNMIEIKNDYH